jgi:hypothetical protein
MINPAGKVYNPVSAGATIDFIIDNKNFSVADLYIYKGVNLSFCHYTNFSSDDPEKVLDRINSSTQQAHNFLKNADFLFVTFGTSRVFRFNETGKIVSNCHKLPASMFTRELLTVDKITDQWSMILDRLALFNKKLRIIFTISPVRHWKDGAHGNQVSKSVLFLAVEELLKHPSVERYFPAYELLMDELRDYRFYDDDMLHPSRTAIDYIWNAFSDCWFDGETRDLWKNVYSIKKARNHRFLTDSATGKREFARTILKQISELEEKNTSLNFSEERSYFQSLSEE